MRSQHYNKWYPIEKSDKSPQIKNFLDSLIKLYPQLLDENYYHRIYKKQFVLTGKHSTYETTKIPIPEDQYYSLINEINLSGFWSLPYLIDCKATIADGEEFTLEANTKMKYQKVTVQTCPNNRSAFTIACQKLIRMAKLEKEVDLIWEEPESSTKNNANAYSVVFTVR